MKKGKRYVSGARRAASVADSYGRLGEFIHKQNPYPWKMELPRDFDKDESVEKDGPGKYFDVNTQLFSVTDVSRLGEEEVLKGLFWHFNGRVRRVSKAIRIPYYYRDKKTGKTRYQALLIGYEGMGGG